MFVRSIIENISVSDKREEEIRQKQNTDSICCQVINYYKMDYWPEAASQCPKLRPYWLVRENLSQELLLYQSRLITPMDLQNDILDCIHEGHQSIVKCRALARENVCLPGLSKQIAKKVGKCSVCEKERKYSPEPLQSSVTRLLMAKIKHGYVRI